mmetsp:Transcript_20747/g.57630  ORF Transcript_20747/g.57630 Transcript_20747/m.57630 type:complete len:460 (-) Transcript_20747:943-2322(-)|eukprot:CAMPEP_0172368224 /NCGR_PEP_ID=MMETSP1060-20121228/25802_1 /TAXON_ID=37318 /ORGANISM="Pseudo-nitzschia pungens, Strain cf. cingulata" /LENGTH=459 /DNA_ID=CAMNT_0013092735 /DNA_START=108 /DNA_END=1490 /DNA_ORIENTATION=-
MASTTTTTTMTKIIVLDDDPTGSQTVHSCLLLTKWDVETLKVALTDDSSPLFFVLTNTRGMSPGRAADVTREVCQNLKSALTTIENITINPILVSRSDSTLRGHYPVETNIISEELGPFDAHFLIPAFFEGGRITRNGTHYLFSGDNKELIPCHETEFAKDSVFGYTTAYLPDYVAEKTKGQIPSERVEHFTLSEVQGDCSDRLLSLSDNTCCVVDCEEQSDLDNFAKQLKDVVALSASSGDRPRKFLFRSGASILTSLAMLPPQPIPAQDMCQYVRDGRPGAVVVGSHVKKTSLQLIELLKEDSVVGLEIDVERIRKNEQEEMLAETLARIEEVHAAGTTPVIYTSRTELTDFSSDQERLQFGESVSGFLMDVVERLPPTLGFLISKGGITSNDVLSKGLALRTSRVLGQILPGCSVVKCPSDHPRYSSMPVVIFPGNVGNEFGLVTTYRRFSSPTLS